MSLRAWKRSPSQAGFGSRGWCETRSATSWPTLSRIWANRASKTSLYALRPEAVGDLPASSMPSAPTISQPTVVPRLSIVVLPFANLSDDREQQYFADGITEDLTTDLSRIAGMFVISRNTAFNYRNKSVDTKQIGRELGVRYM